MFLASSLISITRRGFLAGVSSCALLSGQAFSQAKSQVSQVGLVYYADDPTQSPFRIVYPTVADSELNDPRWVTQNLDTTRPVAILIIPAALAPGLGGLTATPGTSAVQALVNFANAQPAVAAAIASNATNLASIQSAALTAAQQAANLKGATPTSIAQAVQMAASKITPIAGQAN